MQHRMKLDPVSFARTQDGIKTLEIRLYDEKRRQVKVGDTILFQKLLDLSDSLEVEVIETFVFPNFAELFENLPPQWIGYEEKDKEYLKTSMYKIYTPEDEKSCGAFGIRLKKI